MSPCSGLMLIQPNLETNPQLKVNKSAVIFFNSIFHWRGCLSERDATSRWSDRPFSKVETGYKFFPFPERSIKRLFSGLGLPTLAGDSHTSPECSPVGLLPPALAGRIGYRGVITINQSPFPYPSSLHRSMTPKPLRVASNSFGFTI